MCDVKCLRKLSHHNKSDTFLFLGIVYVLRKETFVFCSTKNPKKPQENRFSVLLCTASFALKTL